MIPEYLLWKLCGVKAREYTNATSTGLVNAQTGEYDPEILQALGLPETMFPTFTPAFPWATRIGTAARATAYRTKEYFWRTMPEGST